MKTSRSSSPRKVAATNQRAAFIAAARAAECDEDEGRFGDRLRKIAHAKPAPKPSKSKRK